MKIIQGLIPAAGSGTRLGPFTRAIPKELLPVGDKAVIEHVVEAMSRAGITRITIVISPHKHGLSDYLGSGKRFGVNFSYVVQDERLGLANAVLAGESTITGPFVVVLGDNFISPKSFIQEIIQHHIQHTATATIGVTEVEDVGRYGIIKPQGDHVVEMVEKPTPETAPSNLGAIGAYVFERSIFDAIEKTPMDKNGEYQLTDAIRILIQDDKNNVLFKKIDGIHIDVGTPQDLMRANAWYFRDCNHTI